MNPIPIELLTGYWTDLKDHALRDAIFLVSPEIDLADCALKIATDEAAIVAKWIKSSKLKRPSIEQMKAWSKTDGKSFAFVIVQPHVLIQESGH